VKTTHTIADLRETLDAFRAETIGLVPTMGALHAGHLSLFEAARAECGCVVASAFVNPAQFGPGEDLARYPRDEERDAGIAAAAGVDVLFAPSSAELYPPGYQTWVDVEELAKPLEGAFRPGHFRGVATICLKLFNIVRPQRAYFGQKDAQQALVLRRMIADLNLDRALELRILPTVRDDDGLALSSRNGYLTAADRERALALPRALRTRDPVRARELLARAEIDTDYVDVLEDDGMRVLAGAIRIGSTRLIDNVPLEGGME
jgi:pantoate--beta-alanine ligase